LTAWLGEKVSRLKLRHHAGDGLGLFESLEFLSLGITGKLKLWRALEVATTSNPRLRGLDFHQLAARAETQHAQVEKWRLPVAQAVFGTKALQNTRHTRNTRSYDASIVQSHRINGKATGKPFVGPAGKLLDTALVEAGIDRKKVYVTNAVKHFKWEPRGKRRIHKKPNAAEIAACRPWLDSEIAAIRPKVIVCLGATAAQALLGKDFRVTQHRGEFIESTLAPYVAATVHPSSFLRAPDVNARHEEMARFIADLKKITRVLQ
jgi:uracil-DNA glycosylase family 4